MTKIISVINFKGGVGKTTTTHSLGSALKTLGKNVLLVDIDPQASLTFATLEVTPIFTIGEVFLKKIKINNSIIKTSNFDIIPSNLSFNLVERQLFSKFGTEKILQRALEDLNTIYDYIIIDCPPSLNLFTINAIIPSDYIIIPCETEVFALDGLNLLEQALVDLKSDLDLKVKKTVILPTKIDRRKSVAKEVEKYLEEMPNCTKSKIRICSKLNLLGVEKKSIFEIDKNCTASQDYLDLAKEVETWQEF